MKTRKLRQPDELKAASHHVWYEFTMFAYVAQHPVDRTSQGFLNLVVQSFALHLRNVIDFLYPGKVNNDWMIARDFVPDWDNVRPEITDRLEKAKRRVHKEIVHLSYDRIKVTKDAKQWDRVAIAEDIQRALIVFDQELDNALRSDDWRVEPFKAGLTTIFIESGEAKFLGD